MASRPFSTPKRNIIGSVTAMAIRLPKKAISSISAEAPSPRWRRYWLTSRRTRVSVRVPSAVIQPKTYFSVTMSRAE